VHQFEKMEQSEYVDEEYEILWMLYDLSTKKDLFGPPVTRRRTKERKRNHKIETVFYERGPVGSLDRHLRNRLTAAQVDTFKTNFQYPGFDNWDDIMRAISEVNDGVAIFNGSQSRLSLTEMVQLAHRLQYMYELSELVDEDVLDVFAREETRQESWGMWGSEKGQFKRPSGVAVRGDEVFISDKLNHRVQVFELDGSFVRQWGTKGAEEGQLYFPEAIVVSEDEVFVCDKNDQVQVFDLYGNFQRRWKVDTSSEMYRRPFAIAVTSEEVFVCAEGQVRVYDRYGLGKREWQIAEGKEEKRNDRYAVAVSESQVFVCDTATDQIQVYEMDGSLVMRWGISGSDIGQLLGPMSLALNGNDMIVCDKQRVQFYSLDGELKRVQYEVPMEDSGPTVEFLPTGVSVSASGEVFVSDFASNQIHRFCPNWIVIEA